jgi:hypothetical protein
MYFIYSNNVLGLCFCRSCVLGIRIGMYLIAANSVSVYIAVLKQVSVVLIASNDVLLILYWL